jgi:rsbT co-antagonist protein RsbR
VEQEAQRMSHDDQGPAAASQDIPADNLLRRIAELERALDQQSELVSRQNSRINLLQIVIDHIPYAIYWKDTQLTYQGCNKRFASDLELPGPEAIVGRTDHDLPWQADEAAAFEAADRRIMETQQPFYDDNESVVYPDGSQEWFETYKLPLHAPDGSLIGVLATYNNVTARKRAEQMVEAQATLLQELSTPVIPLTDSILVLPLVGSIDTRRAQQLLETVLERIAETGAQTLLLDITGVPIIDTHVAQVLIQISNAARLLGARIALTGIRPEVAQALVGLGVELQNMVTYSTLQRGLGDLFALHPRARPAQR